MIDIRLWYCCIYQCKDTNFKANHNQPILCQFLQPVVFTNAKILILKLITTHSSNKLLSLRCIYQCKDTNFKANHNTQTLMRRGELVVFTNAKILILKLITTVQFNCLHQGKLYLPMQRY